MTVQQGDAADDATIANLCKQALQEEGRVDVFFANASPPSGFATLADLWSRHQAGIATMNAVHDVSADAFMRTMRVNTLSCVYS